MVFYAKDCTISESAQSVQVELQTLVTTCSKFVNLKAAILKTDKRTADIVVGTCEDP